MTAPVRAALIALVPLLALAAGAGRARAEAPCPLTEPTEGPGAIDPFRAPSAQATALNAAAKTLYRQGKWDEARAQYRAAEEADAEFLAPALNIACSFVRQERFDEATAEVIRLLDRAYMPWSREVLTAADLGALKVQPQMEEVRRALDLDARRWGADLGSSLLFIARQREPLRLPSTRDATGPVVLVLGLHQEVFAWSPATGRYRQITAEDGRVVALSTSADRRYLLYVTADKLVRNPEGRPPALRGVVLHVLHLPLMKPAKPVPLEGDISGLTIAPGAAGFSIEVEGDRVGGAFALGTDGDPLVPTHAPDKRRQSGRVVLTANGVVAAASPRALPAAATPDDDRCHLFARSAKDAKGIARIEISTAASGRRGQGAPLILRPRFGAGLDGLSIP